MTNWDIWIITEFKSKIGDSLPYSPAYALVKLYASVCQVPVHKPWTIPSHRFLWSFFLPIKILFFCFLMGTFAVSRAFLLKFSGAIWGFSQNKKHHNGKFYWKMLYYLHVRVLLFHDYSWVSQAIFVHTGTYFKIFTGNKKLQVKKTLYPGGAPLSEWKPNGERITVAMANEAPKKLIEPSKFTSLRRPLSSFSN